MNGVIDSLTLLTIICVVIAVARTAYIVMQNRDPDADSVDLLRDRQDRLAEAQRYHNKVVKDRVLWKMNRTVEICRENLNPAKLAPGNDRHIHYYLGYLIGFAEAVSLADGVEFDRTLRLPVCLEAGKLLGSGRGEIAEGEALLDALKGSEIFEHGREDGGLDGSEAADDSAERYFNRIDRYFRS